MKRVFLLKSFWGLLALGFAFLDHLLKMWVVAHLSYGESKTIFSWLNITLAYNYGLAFSWLPYPTHTQYALLTGLILLLIVGIFIWLLKLPLHKIRHHFGLVLILGGALGNLWDRLAIGYVIDFIDFHVGNWHWYIFNGADVMISIGVFLFLLDFFIPEAQSQ